MKRVLALAAALLLAPLLVRLLLAQSPAPPPSQAPPPPTFTLTDLGSLNGVSWIDQENVRRGPTALNANGQVAGFRLNLAFGDQLIGFLWDTGSFTDLGTGGGPQSFAYGINNAGQIVGASNFSASGQLSAFVWQNGTMINLHPNPNEGSRAYAVNKGGDAAGFIASGGVLPVIWKGGTAAGETTLASLPCSLASCQGEALAINDLGQAAGVSVGGNVNAFRPVMWDSNGQPTDLIPEPADPGTSEANGINNNGVVIGYYQPQPQNNNQVHAFRWQSGVFTDLGTMGTDTYSGAWGINTKGDIVGTSATTFSPILGGDGGRAFLYIAATQAMYDLTTLVPGTSWRLNAGYAINDNGQIVGIGIAPDGIIHGFLLTPNITPTTTTIAPSVNPSVFGQQVSFTATVTPSDSSPNIPTGTVTFSDDTLVLGTVTLSSGTAIFTTSGLGMGAHSVTASYAGDSNFSASTSSAVNQVVNQAATSTALAASPNPANAGQSVTLTVTVTPVAPGGGIPTGTVTFLNGATTLSVTVLTPASTAAVSTSSLTTGTHSVTASYGGDTNFTGSTSTSAVTVTVQGPPPPVQITDNETIHVTDSESFADAFDSEKITVTDQVIVRAFFPVGITPPPPILSAVLNQPYSGLTFSGTGGYQNVSLSESGTVPGITFANSGASTLLSGTPTQAGTFPFTITAKDSIGNLASQNYFLVVAPSCPVIGVSPTGMLGTVVAGSVFSQRFTQFGGVGNPVWSESGALPNGLTFSSVSSLLANLGIISGVPTVPGTFPLTITATDQNGCQGSTNVSMLVVPPPVNILVNETVHVTDTESFPDVFNPEKIHVTDQVSVIPCDFNVSAASPLNLSVGGSGSTPITIASSNGCNLQVNLSTSPATSGVTISLPSTATTGGTSTAATLTVSAGPSVTPTSFTVTVTGTGGLTHLASVTVNVSASISGTTGVVQTLLNAGAITSAGVANALTSKLSAAQSAANPQTSINTVKAFQNQVQAQAGKSIATSFTLSGVTFNPANTLMSDGQGLINAYKTGMIPDPITGYVVDANGIGLAGATLSILGSDKNTVATASTDITGFYFMATTGVLVTGANYTLQVTGMPPGFTIATPATQTFTWHDAADTFSPFVLN